MTVDAHDHLQHALIIETRDHIALIRISRPAERNSLSVATLQELDATLSALSLRDDISAVIFTGTGDAFSSGANMRELQTLTPATARIFAERGQRLFQKIADAPRLTIAAINGYCIGGGLDLALACDVRIASPGAVFAHPGARLGIITGWGGTQRLP
ncbi:MAG TPA: enoyl-CoA hydratase/isomerase family protein, partial [Pyrinomonadaceae bacterium]|nr:enoyl-CoA hydratase/isomerase family protein [Pyrinomonadaceae bacterium]